MHYPDEPAMTERELKEHMTLFQVRPGNCMVALEQQQPVGVVVGTKRDYGVWIQALGCQPVFQRRGIATQLLKALVRKIAIQRAPLVTVDVPTTNTRRSIFRGGAFHSAWALRELPGFFNGGNAWPPWQY